MALEDVTVDQLVRTGIRAAKAGKRDQARACLVRATTRDPRNVLAWLWLSGVVDTPKAQALCLNKVLELEPDHRLAQRGLLELQDRLASETMTKVLAALDAGDIEVARELLLDIVERDEENVQAWLLLGRVASSVEDRRICFENVLALDPDNGEAQEALDILEDNPPSTLSDEAFNEIFNPWATPSVDPEPPQREPPTLAAAVLGEAYVRSHTTVVPEPEPEEVSPTASIWMKYEDVYRCPFCGAPTESEDRRCVACGKSLWVKARRRQKGSLALWNLLALQGFVMALCGFAPIVYLYDVSRRIGLENYFQLLPLYVFGSSGAVSSEMAAAAFALLSRGVFFLLWLPFLFSLLLFIGIYVRWPVVYYLLLIYAVGLMVLSIIGTALVGKLFLLSGALIALLLFLVVLSLEDDLLKNRMRLLLRIDPNLKTGTSFLMRGRLYASREMWALAAIHLRRATGWLTQDANAYLALATVCLKLKEYALVSQALDEVRRIDPTNSQISEIAALLKTEMERAA